MVSQLRPGILADVFRGSELRFILEVLILSLDTDLHRNACDLSAIVQAIGKFKVHLTGAGV